MAYIVTAVSLIRNQPKVLGAPCAQSDYGDCMHADTDPASGNDTDAADGTKVPADDQIAYNVPHAAQVIDLSERQVWELVRSGEIESFKIGASRRISRAALVAYVKRHQQRGAA